MIYNVTFRNADAWPVSTDWALESNIDAIGTAGKGSVANLITIETVAPVPFLNITVDAVGFADAVDKAIAFFRKHTFWQITAYRTAAGGNRQELVGKTSVINTTFERALNEILEAIDVTQVKRLEWSLCLPPEPKRDTLVDSAEATSSS